MKRAFIVIGAGVVVTGMAIWFLSESSLGIDPRSQPNTVRTFEDVAKLMGHGPASESKDDWMAAPGGGQAFYDSLVIAPCNLVPVAEQDVSSQVDGVFDSIEVELGQQVAKGTVLGRLDDRQLRAQVESLQIRAASMAAEKIAKAQFDEADSKVRYALKANESGLTTVPDLEYKTYLYQRERFDQEVTKAREEREAAQKELERARVVLALHEIRSALDGEIVKVYKRAGEAVKQAEPLFRIANCRALRVEGLCKVQQASLIRVGMHAQVEPERRGEQMTELVGHTGAVNAIAVSADGRLIASASEDRNVILWSWPGGARIGALPHPAEVTAVAMFGPSSKALVLTGCADGQARLWRLGGGKNEPSVLAQIHEGGVRAVAFNRDGTLCATGGDDKRIGIWDASAGRLLTWLQADENMPAHQSAVTSVHFAPDGRLISAGRDNVIKVWQTENGGKLLGVHPGRTGEVAQPGISPDGRHILLDMGEELRILDRDHGTRVGSLQNQKQGRFQAFAQYSPSGRLLLTAASNSRLQLWQAPASAQASQLLRQGYAHGFHRGSPFALAAVGQESPVNRLALAAGASVGPKLWRLSGQEIRHFAPAGSALVNCGVFAPDESVVFTGGSDKAVRVWAVPTTQHGRQPLEARITYVGSQVERGTDMVRIRAVLENPTDPETRLRAGLFASMRLFPETANLK